MAALLVLRKVLFVLSVLMSFVVVGLLGHLTSLTEDVGFYYSSFALGIGMGCLTIISLFAFWIVERTRRGALTSLVWFEVAWTSILWILWIATAASITALGLFETCNYADAAVQSTCHQFQTAEAFTYILGIFFFLWFYVLLVVSVIIAATDPSANVWSCPVTEHPYWTDPTKVPVKNTWSHNSPYGQFHC